MNSPLQRRTLDGLFAVQLLTLLALHAVSAAVLFVLVQLLLTYFWVLANATLAGRLYGVRTGPAKAGKLALLTALLCGGYATAAAIWVYAVFGAGITSPWAGTAALLLSLPLPALALATGAVAVQIAVHPQTSAARLD